MTRDLGRVEEVREGEVWEPRARQLQGGGGSVKQEEQKEADPSPPPLLPPMPPLHPSSPLPPSAISAVEMKEATPTRSLAHLRSTSSASALAPGSGLSSPTDGAGGSGWSSASSPSSMVVTPRRRERRRGRGGLEAAMKEAQELAAEGDIDRFIDTADSGYTSPPSNPVCVWGGPGQLTVGVATDPNPTHRRSMEDAHTVRAAFNTAAHRTHRPPPHAAWVGVYDGHGGGYASAYARKHLHRLFAKHWRGGEGDEEVRAAFEAAFAELDEAMSKSRRFATCGSTAVCVLVQRSVSGSESAAFVVHVATLGDAQAVLLLPSSPPVPLSTVHTPANAAECERVASAGGQILMGRVNGVLAVTRALGDGGMKKVGVVAVPEVQGGMRVGGGRGEGERGEGGGGGGEGYVVCGCDGVWDVMSMEEVGEEVWKGRKAGESAQQTATRLCRLCIERGSTDNVTLVVVHLLI